jgi:hypothetical protein
VATAEHARTAGRHNPCGLFAALVRRQLWHYSTPADEDAARRRLHRHLSGAAPPPRPAPAGPAPLSKDAFTVQIVQADLARAGFRGEVFAALHRADPTWTRARWERAQGELAHARRSGAPRDAPGTAAPP